MTYRSKIDPLIGGVLGLSALMDVAIAVFVVLLEIPGRWVIAGVLASIPIFTVWILTSTDYRLEGDALVVRFGPARWSIPLASITKVETSRSAASGPALSLDRIILHHGKDRRMPVSPEDRRAFLEELASRGVVVPRS